MATLDKAAEDARAEREILDADKEAADRQKVLAEARQAILDVLVTPSGTSYTLTDLSLTLRYDNLETGIVVYGDGKRFLASSFRDDKWTPFLAVEDPAGGYALVGSEPLKDLAHLGDLLAVS